MADEPPGEVWHFGCWNWGDLGGGELCCYFSLLHEHKWYLNILNIANFRRFLYFSWSLRLNRGGWLVAVCFFWYHRSRPPCEARDVAASRRAVYQEVYQMLTMHVYRYDMYMIICIIIMICLQYDNMCRICVQYVYIMYTIWMYTICVQWPIDVNALRIYFFHLSLPSQCRSRNISSFWQLFGRITASLDQDSTADWCV